MASTKRVTVSYTHLDVYKRQGMRSATWASKPSLKVGNTTWLGEVAVWTSASTSSLWGSLLVEATDWAAEFHGKGLKANHLKSSTKDHVMSIHEWIEIKPSRLLT